MKQDEYITILKSEYERLKELEKRMNILVQGIEIQKSTLLYGLELLKRQKTLRHESIHRHRTKQEVVRDTTI